MAVMNSVRIANMALGHIGAANFIESFDEASAEARQCKTWYDYCREQTLEAFDWSFARQRQTLALSANAPPNQWAYRYQYPATCLVARRIWNPMGETADAIPFEIEGDGPDAVCVLTDMANAELVFTSNVSNPVVFKKHFIEALSRNLAHHLAFSLSGKADLAKAQADAYTQFIRIAPAIDANERVGKPPRDAEWIRGRGFTDPYASLR